MFGLFKKDISWKDMEFAFMVGCASLLQRGMGLSNPNATENHVINLIGKAGAKLSDEQKHALSFASTQMMMVSNDHPLGKMLLKFRPSDSVINSEFAPEISKEFQERSIRFEANPFAAKINNLYGR